MLAYSILADESDYLVVVKAPGVRVHGPGASPSLIERLREDLQSPDLHLAHRLDEATSGLVLVAKSTPANQALTRLFAERQITKNYLAISDKKSAKKQGWIRGDMAKARDGNWKLLRTSQNPAVTRFVAGSLGPGLRLYVLQPKTGKTHQLRVALKSQGAPILGDARYGGSEADRLYLHAFSLSFCWQGTVRHYVQLPSVGLHFAAPGLAEAAAQLAKQLI